MWTRQRQEQIDRPLMRFDRSDLVEPEEDAKIEDCGTHMDDIKGLELQPELARKARREELDKVGGYHRLLICTRNPPNASPE